MKTRIQRGLKGLGFVLAVSVAVYVVSYVLAHRALETAYSSLEESGRPSTLDDLIPAPIADADNAGLIYKQVFELLESESVDGKDLFSELDSLSNNILSKGHR